MPYSGLKKRIKKNDRGIAKNIVISLAIGIILFIIVLSASSLIMLNVAIDSEYLFLFVLIASGISALFSAFSSSLMLKNKRLIIGISISVVLAVFEFLILLCFNNASLSNLVYLIFPIMIFCGFTGYVIGTNIKK